MQWSPQQNEALSKAVAWLRMKWSPVFYLAGFAGTGKTTLAQELARQVKGKAAFAAFTGKAAYVMRTKGCTGAQTIHSLIYFVGEDPVTRDITVSKRPALDDQYALIIIDECSMVDREMGQDLLSFGIPILVLGDPAQLPPVKGGGFFTSGTPDYLLTEVHRQAQDSTILRLATEIREGKFRPRAMRTHDLTICAKAGLDPALVTSADTLIVARNATRQKYNARIRQIHGRKKPYPEAGELVICLRNDSEAGIFNGQMFSVDESRRRGKTIHMRLSDPDTQDTQPPEVAVREEFFSDDKAAGSLDYKLLVETQQFTFGYAITCHKAQGSQWPRVCVFRESLYGCDPDRWLYTAVTRAADHLTLVL